MAHGPSAWLASLAAAALLLLPPGCAAPPTREQAPAWIDSPPSDAQYLYAVEGFFGALYPQDNQAHAMARARESLGASLRTHVRGVSLLRETHVDSHWDSTILVDSDLVLEHSELVDQWTDRGGLLGRRGTVWVLMRVPKRL